jgi:hypothetical protein
MPDAPKKGFVIDRAGLPADYPTHAHAADFWEQLGRTVATFGFLEEMLGKAIFALTATKEYAEGEAEAAYDEWIETLEKALSDALGRLISLYEVAIKANQSVKYGGTEELISDLRAAAKIRNVICHGSWRKPDETGKSIPMFVTPKMEVFDTPVDVEFLKQVRANTLDLVCSVMDSVTHMGWNFPGSESPGAVIYEPNSAGAA